MTPHSVASPPPFLPTLPDLPLTPHTPTTIRISDTSEDSYFPLHQIYRPSDALDASTSSGLLSPAPLHITLDTGLPQTPKSGQRKDAPESPNSPLILTNLVDPPLDTSALLSPPQPPPEIDKDGEEESSVERRKQLDLDPQPRHIAAAASPTQLTSGSLVWALFRGNQKTPPTVFPATIRSLSPLAIEYGDDGSWEILSDTTRLRPRTPNEEAPSTWSTEPFLSMTYKDRPNHLLDQKEAPVPKKETEDDTFTSWQEEKEKKKKKKKENKEKHKILSTDPEPHPSPRRTKISDFFPPATLNSPSPKLTVNGQLPHSKRQTKLTEFSLSSSSTPASIETPPTISSSSFFSSSSSSSLETPSSLCSSSAVQLSHPNAVQISHPKVLSSNAAQSSHSKTRRKKERTENEKERDESDDEDSSEDSDSDSHSEAENQIENKAKEKHAASRRTQAPNIKDDSRPVPLLQSSHSQEQTHDQFPAYIKANFDPNAKWKQSEKRLQEIQRQANDAFERMRYWRKNLWKPPSGKAGKGLILEQSHLIESWTKGSVLELIALTLNMIFLPLMLQKSGRNVKAKAVKEIVERRLEKWNNGDITELVEEAEYLQTHIQNMSNQSQNPAQLFARLMLQGKVKAALRIVSGMQGGVAKPSEEVLRKLKEKHPEAAVTDHSVILPGEFQKVPDSMWEKIDGHMIRDIALNSKGAGGWSGVDSDDLRPLFCSKNYGHAADNLCDSVAEMTKRLCRVYVDPEALTSFLACRLVPLEKGENDVRPISIGETLRRMVAKAAVKAIRSDIRAACGSLQVCAGMEGGCEAAIHAVRTMFEEDETEAALLIDASNAFNSVKRECTLKNIAVLCPAFFIFLVNTYRRPIRLLIPAWREEILSLEGTTQGDPAAMGMYALSVLPLLKEAMTLCDARTFIQAWYADDGTGVGKLDKLRAWWTILSTLGPKYGYYANARKTILVVKEKHEQKARELFMDTGIEILTSGTRHLGSALGNANFVEDFVKKKIERWTGELETLAKFATSEPQAAYSAFVFGFKGKWTFLQRALPHVEKLYQPLEDLLTNTFLPKLTGRSLTQLEREILSLPARDGGIGISNPIEKATQAHCDSLMMTKELTLRIRQQTWECPKEETIKEAKKQVIRDKRKREAEDLHRVKEKLKQEAQNDGQKRTKPPGLKILESATAKGASCWLTTLPLQDENRVLNKEEFRDALALRYGWKPKNIPQKCACGAMNTVTHCLDCKLGGYVTMRHNEMRNTFAKLLTKAGCKVNIEQQLLPVEGELEGIRGVEKGDEARMDVTALGFWGTWQRAFFDVRVFDPFAQSYTQKSIESIFKAQEKEKKKKYSKRILEIEKATFTPLVFSVTGGCGKECDIVLKKLSLMIAEKTKNTQSKIMNWIRTEIAFTLLRSCITSIRGWRRPRKERTSEEMDFDVTYSRNTKFFMCCS